MLAAITFDNLASGFIGSLFGFALSLLSGYLKSRRDSKDRLRGILLKLGKRLYHESETWVIMKESYDVIVDACIDYQSRLICPWKKSRMETLWHDLIGHDPKTCARHCHAFPEKREAMKATEELLRFIGYGYPKPPET